VIDAAEIDKEEEWGTHRSARSHYQRRARTLITQDFRMDGDRRTYLSGMRMESLRWLSVDSRNNHEKRDCDATLARRLVKRFRRLPCARRAEAQRRCRHRRGSSDDGPLGAPWWGYRNNSRRIRAVALGACRTLTTDVAPAARDKTFSYEDKALAPHRDLFLLRLRRDRRGGLEGSVRRCCIKTWIPIGEGDR
jgi:hypothetical protein